MFVLCPSESQWAAEEAPTGQLICLGLSNNSMNLLQNELIDQHQI
jgi:hypothetical protein